MSGYRETRFRLLNALANPALVGFAVQDAPDYPAKPAHRPRARRLRRASGMAKAMGVQLYS